MKRIFMTIVLSLILLLTGCARVATEYGGPKIEANIASMEFDNESSFVSAAQSKTIPEEFLTSKVTKYFRPKHIGKAQKLVSIEAGQVNIALRYSIDGITKLEVPETYLTYIWRTDFSDSDAYMKDNEKRGGVIEHKDIGGNVVKVSKYDMKPPVTEEDKRMNGAQMIDFAQGNDCFTVFVPWDMGSIDEKQLLDMEEVEIR